MLRFKNHGANQRVERGTDLAMYQPAANENSKTKGADDGESDNGAPTP